MFGSRTYFLIRRNGFWLQLAEYQELQTQEESPLHKTLAANVSFLEDFLGVLIPLHCFFWESKKKLQKPPSNGCNLPALLRSTASSPALRVVGCTLIPTWAPYWEIPPPKKISLCSGYLWVIIHNPQESLENTINSMGTWLGVHPIFPLWNL